MTVDRKASEGHFHRIGLKICPSTPCMVNKGTNAAAVTAVEKKTALSTCKALA